MSGRKVVLVPWTIGTLRVKVLVSVTPADTTTLHALTYGGEGQTRMLPLELLDPAAVREIEAMAIEKAALARDGGPV